MLFNSYDFVLYFLPLALVGFYAFGHTAGMRTAAAWLALTSIVFYAYWTPRFVLLLLASVAVNFIFGVGLRKLASRPSGTRRDHLLLALAIFANLGLLFYFKYANFFLDSASRVLGSRHLHLDIVLPLGISFFTFTQIAYLVDVYQRKVPRTDPIHYLLFVTYFPHLIAGPILHHAEMMPQFAKVDTYRLRFDWLFAGVMIFAIGLAKKVVLADGIQPYVGPVFDAPADQAIGFFAAWGAALAYTLQLYFDFSGYSDMAIGLARMCNIALPLNFDSPYKARNISDFWRRWHMTLSRFLRDYLYIPLGGNRRGRMRRYVNLMITMLLGGLWHGAGWTFVVWGGLHGVYLCCHHGWSAITSRMPSAWKVPPPVGATLAWLVTFLCVVVGWVFFRATSLPSAVRVLKGMGGIGYPNSGANGIADGIVQAMAAVDERQLVWTLALLAIALWMPNTQSIVGPPGGGIQRIRLSRLAVASGVLVPVLLLLLVVNASRGISEFIYFNF